MSTQRFWKEDGFSVVVALDPPKGADPDAFLAQAAALKGRVDAVLVADAPDAVMRMTPLAACTALASRGLRPILGMNGRDRNRIAIQGDLLGAWSLGVRDVLFEDGKDPSFGDHPLTKPIHDLRDAELVEMAASLNAGKDMAGIDLAGKTDFTVCAAAEWLDDEVQNESAYARMEFLASRGCMAFVVSPQFDIDRAKAMCRRAAAAGAAVLVGVMLLKSVGMARYLNEVPGISHVPADVVDRLAAAPVKARAGVGIAVDFIQALRGHARGVVLMPVGWAQMLPGILDGIGR